MQFLFAVLFYKGVSEMSTGCVFQTSSFKIDESSNVYISHSLDKDTLFSKNALYYIDFIQMKAQEIVTIRDADSDIYLGHGKLVYQSPKSLLTFLSYGPSMWHIADINEKSHRISNLQELPTKYEDIDYNYRYFIVNNQIFCAVEPIEHFEGKDTSKLYCFNNGNLQYICSANTRKIYNYDSIIVLEFGDDKLIYYNEQSDAVDEIDFMGDRLCDIILSGEFLFYANDNYVVAYDLREQTAKVLKSHKAINIGLFCNESFLYVYDGHAQILYKYQIDNDLLLMSTYKLNRKYTNTDFIVINDKFLTFSVESDEIYVFDLNNREENTILLGS